MNRREFIFGGIAALASLFVPKSPRDKETETAIGETELTVTTNDALTYDELAKSVNQFYALNDRIVISGVGLGYVRGIEPVTFSNYSIGYSVMEDTPFLQGEGIEKSLHSNLRQQILDSDKSFPESES